MLEDIKVSLASLRKCQRALHSSINRLQALEALPWTVPSGTVKRIIRESFAAQGFHPDSLSYRARFDRLKTVGQALAFLRPALKECSFVAKAFHRL